MIHTSFTMFCCCCWQMTDEWLLGSFVSFTMVPPFCYSPISTASPCRAALQADLSAQWSKYHHFCEQMDPIKQRLQQVPQDSEQVGNIVCVCVCACVCACACVYVYACRVSTCICCGKTRGFEMVPIKNHVRCCMCSASPDTARPCCLTYIRYCTYLYCNDLRVIDDLFR